MRVPFLLLTLGLAGCAASAPPVTAPRVPVIVAPPPPEPILVETQPVEVVPVEPAETPRRRIAQRSVFEDARIAEWVLENGLTVLYAWDDGADGYAVQLTRTGSPSQGEGAVPAGLLRRQTGGTLAEALSAARDAIADAGGPLGSVLVAMHGSASFEWIEPLVARDLGALAPRAGASAAAPPRGQASLAWADLPDAFVLAALLGDGASGPLLILDGAEQALRLPASRPGRADAGEIRDARERAARFAEAPLGVLLALDVVYRLPGRYRPARSPADVRLLADRIRRVPPQRVAEWLGRLTPSSP